MVSSIGNSNSINSEEFQKFSQEFEKAFKQAFKQKYSANFKPRSKEFEETSYKNKKSYKYLLYEYKYFIIIITLSFVLSRINSNDLIDYRSNKLGTFKPVRSWVGKGKHIDIKH